MPIIKDELSNKNNKKFIQPGDIVECNGEYFIIINIYLPLKYFLISLKDGNRWNDGGFNRDITPTELLSELLDSSITRPKLTSLNYYHGKDVIITLTDSKKE